MDDGGDRRGRSRRLRVLLVAFAVGAGSLVSGVAQAHAALVKSVPGSREIVRRTPAALVLKFNERVEARFSTVSLERADGTPLDLGPLQLSADDPTQIEIAIPAALASGTYTVRYRVLSQDGHVVEYGYQFRVVAPAGDDD